MDDNPYQSPPTPHKAEAVPEPDGNAAPPGPPPQAIFLMFLIAAAAIGGVLLLIAAMRAIP